MPKSKQRKTWIWVGDLRKRAFVAGVPARDLTQEEAERYGVLDSPCWEPVPEATQDEE